MSNAADSEYRVPFDGSFAVSGAATRPPEDAPGKKELKRALKADVKSLATLQKLLYADDRYSLLLVFQAMDAAGKDGTIRAVLSGVNPAGCAVHSFKAPSSEELDHDYLWRTASRLPERGKIGVFNRSYYEEVLVVRVHPAILDGQRLPDRPGLETLWGERLESIAEHERHLARNGTIVLKFWLNVSWEEQRRRFFDRIDDPAKNWKFHAGDLAERSHWDAYMAAYEDALRATSRPEAPWYAIPADNKHFMRATVARILVETMESLGLEPPEASADELARLSEFRRELESQQR